MNTVVILAGGKSRRMGADKLALPLGGASMLRWVERRYARRFDMVYISVADAEKYPDVEAARITDIFPGCGPMGGLHAALLRAEGAGVFLTAADLPFSSPEAALKIIELCGGADACVLRDTSGRAEPLFAYYTKALLPVAEGLLRAGQYRMTALLAAADVRFVSPAELGELWYEAMIMNVNRPEDYERAKSWLSALEL